MTPAEYLEQVRALFRAERWHEALAFAEQGIDTVWPALSGLELDRLNGMMEVAANIAQILGQEAQEQEAAHRVRPDIDVSAGRS